MNRAKLLALATAILAAGITLRATYDPAEDELQIRIRKVKPLVAALKARNDTLTP